MRDYKFRGKRIDNGEWVCGSLIGSDVIVGPIVEWTDEYFYNEFWWKVDPETVGQYTGQPDINGADIYDGDVTKDEFGRVGIICWKENESRFAIRYVGQKTEYRMFINHLKVEVLGSIHEHPHLLEQGEKE